MAHLFTLEGNDSLSSDKYFLKNQNHIVRKIYSPLHGEYVEPVLGYESNETILQDQNLYHFLNGYLLGVSIPVDAGTLGNDFPFYAHYNLDGSFVGFTGTDENGNPITIETSNIELGFSLKGFKGLKLPKLGGFKLPKFSMPKIKLPKISLPKIKLPKISLPKISLPKISLPKIKLPDIGSQISKIGSNIGNAFDKFGNKIGESFTQAADIAKELITAPLDIAQSLMSQGGQAGYPEEENGYPEEEQALDYTQPGYQDETGYTASDGNFYTHDGTMYLDSLTGQWVSLEEQALDYTQVGYEDNDGFTASDGNYYLRDGSGFLRSGTWYKSDGTLWGDNYLGNSVEPTNNLEDLNKIIELIFSSQQPPEKVLELPKENEPIPEKKSLLPLGILALAGYFLFNQKGKKK